MCMHRFIEFNEHNLKSIATANPFLPTILSKGFFLLYFYTLETKIMKLKIMKETAYLPQLDGIQSGSDMV